MRAWRVIAIFYSTQKCYSLQPVPSLRIKFDRMTFTFTAYLWLFFLIFMQKLLLHNANKMKREWRQAKQQQKETKCKKKNSKQRTKLAKSSSHLSFLKNFDNKFITKEIWPLGGTMAADRNDAREIWLSERHLARCDAVRRTFYCQTLWSFRSVKRYTRKARLLCVLCAGLILYMTGRRYY